VARRHFPRLVELAETPADEDHRLDVTEHPGELLLVQLKRRQRDSELLPFFQIPVSIGFCFFFLFLHDKRKGGERIACDETSVRTFGATYRWHMSKTPIDMPTGCHATIMREMASTCFAHSANRQADLHHRAYSLARQKQKQKQKKKKRWAQQKQNRKSVVGRVTLLMSWNELMPGNRSSSGTNTLFKTMSPFWTILRPILFSIFVAFRPGAPFRTMNLVEARKQRQRRTRQWKLTL
jgi:hypothetical protein